MDNVQFPVTLVVDVTIQPTPDLLGVPNINTAALISQEEPSGWDEGETFRKYTSPDAVGDDFGLDSSAYAIAVKFFQQNPNVIGTGGYLAVIPRLTSPSLETVQAAILRMKDTVYFFGILIDSELATDDASAFQALCNYVQTLDKVFAYASSVIAQLAPSGVLDLVRQADDKHVRCLYYGNALLNGADDQQTQMFAAAYLGRALSVDFQGSLTAQTMNLKALSGITPDQTLTETYLGQAQDAGVDVYINIGSVPKLYTSGANGYWDEVYNELALKFALQTAGFNYLAGTNTKIPQTESGMTGLKSAYLEVLAQFVANGVLAPGAWTSPSTFGDPASLAINVRDLGYYIYSKPVSQQSASDRQDRKAPLCQIAAKMAGAIHSTSVIVNINQ